MSNFVCPTCGFTNIDCGKDGYKTLREIDEGNRSPYKNCRPVSRDEVAFYEDKKDE